MAVENVPWMVAGGAEHSAESARTLAHMALEGGEGVTKSTDMLVKPLAIAGDAVRISPGTGGIENRYPGATSESYIARVTSDTNVTIAPTAGSPRSDLIVLRIDDPQYGGTVPADRKVGPYVRPDIIPNVGSAATKAPAGTNYPVLVLARVDVPASTGTITGAMIKDLRKLARPRRQRDILTKTSSTATLNSTAAYVPFPASAGFEVEIPIWATRVRVVANLAGAIAAGPGAGFIRVQVGSLNGTSTSVDEGITGNPQRWASFAVLNLPVPIAMRGTTQTVNLYGQKTGGTSFSSTGATSLALDLEFLEEPSSE